MDRKYYKVYYEERYGEREDSFTEYVIADNAEQAAKAVMDDTYGDSNDVVGEYNQTDDSFYCNEPIWQADMSVAKLIAYPVKSEEISTEIRVSLRDLENPIAMAEKFKKLILNNVLDTKKVMNAEKNI